MLLFFPLPFLSFLFLHSQVRTHKIIKKKLSITFLGNVVNSYSHEKPIKEGNISFHNNRNRVKNVIALNSSFGTNEETIKQGQKNDRKEVALNEELYASSSGHVNTDIITHIKNAKNKAHKWNIKKDRKQQNLKTSKELRDLKKDIKLQFFKKRILYLTDEINKKTSEEIITHLLYLDSLNNEDIKIFINSPGGSINDGLAILDIFHFIKSDIVTISFGLVASMGSVILAAGKKGKRKSFPNCRIMIHQPLGNAYGQPEDIEIQTKEILYLKNLLYHYLSIFTNQTTDTIRKHSDRDYYMNANEAKEYGIVDEVIDTKLPNPNFKVLKT